MLGRFSYAGILGVKSHGSRVLSGKRINKISHVFTLKLEVFFCHYQTLAHTNRRPETNLFYSVQKLSNCNEAVI
jgi:hypothetical protein